MNNKDEDNEYTLYSYYALEAKIVCDNITFSLVTEFVENEIYMWLPDKIVNQKLLIDY